MNLAQELYLCALDGSAVHSHKLPPGIGGALLAELGLRGRAQLGEQVTVTDRSPTGDPLLDGVLESWGEAGPAEVSRVVSGLGQANTKRVVERTLADGLAAEHRGEKRRLLPGHKSPYKLATEAGEEPRNRAREVLLGRRQPDERTRVLVTLVGACGLVGGLVPKDERRSAEERARSMADAEGVSEAVRDVIRTVQTSVAGQISAATLD